MVRMTREQCDKLATLDTDAIVMNNWPTKDNSPSTSATVRVVTTAGDTHAGRFRELDVNVDGSVGFDSDAPG